MKIRKHSLQYLIDTEKDVNAQLKLLDSAVSEFFGEYSISPDCPIAVKTKTPVEIELHPLKEGWTHLNLQDKRGFLIRPSGAGLAIPDAIILKTENYRYEVYFSNKYLEKGL